MIELNVSYPVDKRRRKIRRWAVLFDNNFQAFRLGGVTVEQDDQVLDFIRITTSSPIVAYDPETKIMTTESGTTYELLGDPYQQNQSIWDEFIKNI